MGRGARTTHAAAMGLDALLDEQVGRSEQARWLVPEGLPSRQVVARAVAGGDLQPLSARLRLLGVEQAQTQRDLLLDALQETNALLKVCAAPLSATNNPVSTEDESKLRRIWASAGPLLGQLADWSDDEQLNAQQLQLVELWPKTQLQRDASHQAWLAGTLDRLGQEVGLPAEGQRVIVSDDAGLTHLQQLTARKTLCGQGISSHWPGNSSPHLSCGTCRDRYGRAPASAAHRPATTLLPGLVASLVGQVANAKQLQERLVAQRPDDSAEAQAIVRAWWIPELVTQTVNRYRWKRGEALPDEAHDRLMQLAESLI